MIGDWTRHRAHAAICCMATRAELARMRALLEEHATGGLES